MIRRNDKENGVLKEYACSFNLLLVVCHIHYLNVVIFSDFLFQNIRDFLEFLLCVFLGHGKVHCKKKKTFYK